MDNPAAAKNLPPVEPPSRKRRGRQRETVAFKNPWYCPRALYANGKYPAKCEGFAQEYDDDQSLAFPINFDTEYNTPQSDGLHDAFDVPDEFAGELTSRDEGTYQIKSTTNYHPFGGSIYVSESLYNRAFQDGREDQIRHPVIRGDAIVPFEYMRDSGESVDYFHDHDAHENPDVPLFVFVVYAHFAVADVPLLATGDYQEDIISRFAGDRSQGVPRAFEQKRRLTTKSRNGIANLPWRATINGNRYRVGIQVVDTNALHGQASYADLAKTTGVAIEAKDYMRETLDGHGRPLIEDMYGAYFSHPQEYDRYSLGDLRVSEILERNVRLSRGLYDDLDLGEYFKQPALSIGSTVAHVSQAVLAKHFDLPPEVLDTKKGREGFLDMVVRTAKADHLRRQVYSNLKDLAKVEGGLCRTKRTVDTTIRGNLIDLDLGGAYASRMAMMLFPCGEPVLESFGDGIPLRLWLRDRRRNLVPGTWLARVSTKTTLTHEQDLILSYWGAKNDVERKADEEGYEALLDLDSGNSKTLGVEINGGALNDTLLEIIEKVLSPRQRKDFLDKLVVTSSAYYPADQRIDDPAEWWEIATTKKGVKKYAHKWHPIEFGPAVIDRIRAIRASYPKGTPQNLYAKLIANTTYGVSISRYFLSSNMVFGANVTAGVRSAMWLAEKGLNLFGSITDGQCFDPGAVLYRHKKTKHFATHQLARLGNMSPREIHDATQFRIAPLHPDHAKLSPDEINRLCLEHLQTQFPTVDFLNAPLRKLDTGLNQKNGDKEVRYTDGRGFLVFEMKARVEQATLHGSANYNFRHPDNSTTLKARSYRSKSPYFGYRLEGDQLVPTGDYQRANPPGQFLDDIALDPHAVPLRPPFASWALLKPDEYAKNITKWIQTNLIPGDAYPKAGLWRPFSLAQFNFRTVNQYETWQRVVTRLKNRHGYSLELFFLNDDGTLDYKRMLDTLERMISRGVVNPLKALDPDNHGSRDRKRHPAKYATATNNWQSLQTMKNAIETVSIVPDDGIEEIDGFAYDRHE